MRPLKKIISLFLLAVFFAQNAYGTVPAGVFTVPLTREAPASAPFFLDLPPELGTIETVISGSGPTVIHIQEAHGDVETQKKIEAILKYLQEHYHLSHLMLEGDAFNLHSGLLDFFPKKKELNRTVLEQLAFKGMAAGPMFFLQEYPETEAWGVEDLRSYRANGQVFVEVQTRRRQTEQFVQAMNLQIERLTSPYLRKELRHYLKRNEDFERGLVPLDVWLEELRGLASQYLGKDLSKPALQVEWPMLVRYYTLRNFESRLDMKAFEAERERFIQQLSRLPETISVPVIRHLRTALNQHRLPDPDTGILFETMVAQLPPDFSFKPYPNVSFFIGHLILQSELKADRLLAEISRLTDQISQTLAAAPIEKEIAVLLKKHRLLKRLFRLELTPADYAEIDQTLPDQNEKAVDRNRESFRPSFFIQRFNQLNTDKRVRDYEFSHLKEVDGLYEKALEFYRGARERDQQMLTKIDRHFKDGGVDKACVITGGFHSGPFKEFFERKGYNYALITPRIGDAAKTREIYVQSVLQNTMVPSDQTKATYRGMDFTALLPNEIEASGGNVNRVRAALHDAMVTSARKAGFDADGAEKEAAAYDARRWENQTTITPPAVLRSEVRAKQGHGGSQPTEAAITRMKGLVSSWNPSLPGWMGKGIATRAWDHPSIDRRPVDLDKIRPLLSLLYAKVEALAQGDLRTQALRVLDHLSQIKIEDFDDQHWAESGSLTSYLLAYADSKTAAIGRGAFEDAEFGARILFQTVLESLNLQETSSRKPALEKSNIIAAVFPEAAEKIKFEARLKAWIELDDPAFLQSAVSRFHHFEPGSPYYKTTDLLKDWFLFSLQHEKSDDGAHYPVTEQAGFLMRKLWPRVNPAGDQFGKSENPLVEVDAFFRVIYPFLAFAISRYQFINAVKIVFDSAQDEVKQKAREFHEATTWMYRAFQDSKNSVEEKRAGSEYDHIDQELWEEAKDYTVAWIRTRAAKQTLPKFGLSKEEPITLDQAMQRFAQKMEGEYRKGSNTYKHVPSFALLAAIPETLTPQTGDHFLKERDAMMNQALSHWDWLETALPQYFPTSADGQQYTLFLEGFISGAKNSMAAEKLEQALFYYSRIKSQDNRFILTNTLAKTDENIWLGVNEVLDEREIPFGASRSAPHLLLLTSGNTPVSAGMMPKRRGPLYQQDGPGKSLTVFLHKNTVIAEILDWIHHNWRAGQALEEWEKPIQGIWAALARIRMTLSENPALPDTFFSPARADVSSWADEVLRLWIQADSAYWRTVYFFTQGSPEHFSAGAEDSQMRILEMYSLVRNPDGLFAALAAKLEQVPGSDRLTDAAARAVLDTLFALWWSGAPRSDRADAVFDWTLSQFRKQILFHSDGLSVPDLADFKKFLTAEVSEMPVEKRSRDDFEKWQSSTRVLEALALYAPGAVSHEADFSAREFLPPEINPGTGSSDHAQMRALAPSYFDAEQFPAENLLKPEKWPAWENYPARKVVEWGTTYTESGLVLPGDSYAYHVDSLKPGDLVQVLAVVKQAKDRSPTMLEMVKVSKSLPQSPGGMAAGQVQEDSRLKERRPGDSQYQKYHDMLEKLAFQVSDEEILAARAGAQPMSESVKERLLARLKARLSVGFKSKARGGDNAAYNTLSEVFLEHLKAKSVVTFKEIRRLNPQGTPEYLLADGTATHIYLAKELAESPENENLATALLFFATSESISHFSADSGQPWTTGHLALIMEMAEKFLPELLPADDAVEHYIKKGLVLLRINLEKEARADRGMAGHGWQKVPLLDKLEPALSDLYSSVADPAVLPEEFAAGGKKRKTAVEQDGWYRLQSGPNGLFIFSVKKQPVAIDIPRFPGGRLLIHAQAHLQQLDVYSEEGVRFLGTLKAALNRPGVFVSQSAGVNVKEGLPESVAHLGPRTAIDYQNFQTLAIRLEPVLVTGRGYSRIDFISEDLEAGAEQEPVQIDLTNGRILLDRTLAADGNKARSLADEAVAKESNPVVKKSLENITDPVNLLVLLALHHQDPVYEVKDRLQEMTAFIPWVDSASAKTAARPVPEILPFREGLSYEVWKDGGAAYRQLYEQMQMRYQQLTVMRAVDQYRQANLLKFPRKDFPDDKFRQWLSMALDHADPDKVHREEFYFVTKTKGATIEISGGRGLLELKYQEKGVGVTTPAYFSSGSDGQYTLRQDKRRIDPTGYLFIRYVDPQNSTAMVIDVFDLKTGQLIQNKTIDFEQRRSAFDNAFGAMKERAKESGSKLPDEIFQKIRDAIEGLQLTAPEIEEHHAVAAGQQEKNPDLWLWDIKIEVLGYLNQFLHTALNSDKYPLSINATVLDLILTYIISGPASEAAIRAKKLQGSFLSSAKDPYAAQRLLRFFKGEGADTGGDFAVYMALMSEGSNKDLELFDTPSDAPEYAHALENLTQEVLLPWVRATTIENADLTLPSGEFFNDLFGNIFPNARDQIEDQIATFISEKPAEEFKEGFTAFLPDFLNVYQPVVFPHKDSFTEVQSAEDEAGMMKREKITSMERYVIEKLFRERDTAAFKEAPAEEGPSASVESVSTPSSAPPLKGEPTLHTQFGASAGIGASSALVEYKNSRIIVDAGIKIDDRNTPPNWPQFTAPPEAVFLTHDHLDHVGAVIKLWRNLDKKVPVYVTPGSYALLPSVLGAMMTRDGDNRAPAFTYEEIKEFMQNVYPLKVNQWYQVTPEMKVYYHGPVGHLHGAASLIISTPDSTTFMMGDISYRAQGPVPAWEDIPEEIRKHIDRAVIEATNGMADRKSEETEEREMAEAIRARLDRGGKVLLPSFANGRAQRNLFLILKELSREPKYRNLKIYVDGQAAWFTLLYLNENGDAFKPFAEWIRNNLVIIPDPQWDQEALAKLSVAKSLVPILLYRTVDEIRTYRTRTILRRDKGEPTVIISSSGNASQGRSHWWAQMLAGDSDNAIYFTGYMDEDEAGSRLLDLAARFERGQIASREFYFQGGKVLVNAEIKRFGLSGHILGKRTVGILKTFGPSLKQVVIQHGGDSQRREVYQWILRNQPSWNPQLIQDGVSYEGRLPLTREALQDRRDFFHGLTALSLPGRESSQSAVPTPSLNESADLAAASPLAAVVDQSQIPSLTSTLNPGESTVAIADLELTGSAAALHVDRVDFPLDEALTSASAGERGLTPMTDFIEAGIDLSTALPTQGTPDSSQGIVKAALSPEVTAAVFAQILKSRTVPNAIGKLTDEGLFALDEMIRGKEELVNPVDAKIKYPVSTAVKTKLDAEFQKRGLQRSEVRRGQADFENQRRVRHILANDIFPLTWSESILRSEIRYAEAPAVAQTLNFPEDWEMQMNETARKIISSHSPRQLIDARAELPSTEEMAAILALLNRQDTLHYVLIIDADDQAEKNFMAALERGLQEADLRRRWGDLDPAKLGERFKVIGARAKGEAAGAVDLKARVLENVLAGKRSGSEMLSAVIGTGRPMASALGGEARMYHFLNLYTPEKFERSAVLWMAAVLLDEISERELAQFDAAQLAGDPRWQSLTSEMSNLMAIRTAA